MQPDSPSAAEQFALGFASLTPSQADRYSQVVRSLATILAPLGQVESAPVSSCFQNTPVPESRNNLAQEEA